MQTNPQPLDAKAPVRELTLRGVILGALITVVFTSSNVYLGLKVGLTFSSSIPATIIAMAVLGRLLAGSNVLECNIVQTLASAAGTLASVIFTLPAILMVGYWNGFPFWQTFLICAAGGCLGVLFSIPLRKTMVVGSTLPYPEGVAAAEVLKAGCAGTDGCAAGGSGAGLIFFGAVWSAIVSFCTSGLRLLTDQLGVWFSVGRSVSQIPMGFSMALLSAGYLMGFDSGVALLVGLVLSWYVLVPLFTAGLPAHAATLAETANQVWDDKVRFVGAGTLAIAAVWTMLTLLKPMAAGIRMSVRSLHGGGKKELVARTDEDMPMRSLLAVAAVMLVVLLAALHSFVKDAPLSPAAAWALVLVAVALVFLIGFFVASACGYMAGLVGSSNSPISGIGLIGVMLVSLVVMAANSLLGALVGPDGQRFGMALALFTATGIVSVASMANDNLQDLKTGQLVGATPKNQERALLIGCLVGSLVMAPILGLLYNAYGFHGAALPRPDMPAGDLLSAPQASLMASITKGIFTQSLNWDMFMLGIGIGAAIILFNFLLARTGRTFELSALAVGLGIYLPPYTNVPVVAGSVLCLLVTRCLAARDRRNGTNEAETNDTGTMVASGFIVGESLVGVFVALAALVGMAVGVGETPFAVDGWLGGLSGGAFGTASAILSAAVFLAGAAILYRKATK